MKIPVKISEPTSIRAPHRFALWDLGFRPFYMLASCFASLSIGLWALQVYGLLGHAYLAGPLWHAHEMLFGFTLAVVVGFLFTAGRNWSGNPTPTGGKLMALAGLWVAGRVLVLTPFAWPAAIVNCAFPLIAAAALAIPLLRSSSKRNYFFVALLVSLSMAQLLLHLSQLGVLAMPGWVGIQMGLDVVLFILSVMAGRVIPMFTNNGVPGAGATRQPWVEKCSLSLVFLLLVADVSQFNAPLHATVAGLAVLAHGVRWLLWRPWKTLKNPLVWVLHIAYAWIVLHLALRCMADLEWVSSSIAIHALTVGAIGTMVMGMMTRTALGHTGRPLVAGHWEVAAYALVTCAAIVRIAGPWATPPWTQQAILLSGALWSLAFAIYAIRYWPILSRPRVDGLAG